MKNKLLNAFLTFFISCVLGPVLLFILLKFTVFSYITYFFTARYIIKMYFGVLILGFITLLILKSSKNFMIYRLNKIPTIKTKVISIKKLKEKSINLGILEIDVDSDDIYIVKFKHNNKTIDKVIQKNDIKSDLKTDEEPYIEYKYWNLISFLDKFHNITVHTQKN
ncbi:hypothetical protein [Clostridium felsineum]|uniref:Uncharacterized protein n=1 Tax=Clostridium felsineum TaxID=36839 RepID=A0A1S8LJL0_9CLOT|nr:hypothetical protein [Clostridium felsineum]MCR3760089.1 hypothetical protein [Clostridium felsineum]URZ01370.1 hypothetical protein CLAUR_013600 [Clostridium felsineum]URZ05784.1 hypothetical protein CLROS_011150 [Clostridium felsineum]URZ10823.1 hypothetical protein CROST_015380 [Clostridium felsineum]URZ15575.1 hypothetical protein CLFE_016200 [Clostridium felsineum DSM 794]